MTEQWAYCKFTFQRNSPIYNWINALPTDSFKLEYHAKYPDDLFVGIIFKNLEDYSAFKLKFPFSDPSNVFGVYSEKI